MLSCSGSANNTRYVRPPVDRPPFHSTAFYVKSVRKHALEDKVFLDAGKITRLLALLEQYRLEGKRVLIFSQVNGKDWIIRRSWLTGNDSSSPRFSIFSKSYLICNSSRTSSLRDRQLSASDKRLWISSMKMKTSLSSYFPRALVSHYRGLRCQFEPNVRCAQAAWASI